MRKLLIIVCALVPVWTFAQSLCVLETVPASDGGKTLSIGEATTGRGVIPSNRFYQWSGDDFLLWAEKGKRRSLSVRDLSESDTVHITAMRRPMVLPAALDSLKGDGIVIGETVSRNEFGINGGLFPSPDGNKLAFYRKDETAVTDFPLLDIKTRTGSLKSIKYPMNGMPSEHITLGVYNFADSSLVWVKPDDFDDERYLTCVSWNPSSTRIFIQVLDRSQHRMHLNVYDAADGSFVRTLLTEENDAWVEPSEPLHFISDELFIYTTDNRDGYKSLYLCDLDGGIRRLTSCEADVQFVAYKGGYLYYTSAEVSPVENHLFRMRLRMKAGMRLDKIRFDAPARLTSEPGWHYVQLNESGTYFVDRYSSFSFPGATLLKKTDGKLVKELFSCTSPLDSVAHGKLMLGSVKSADGQFDNYYRLLLPVGFDASKKYPLIVYVYGGPHSQMVRNAWLGSIRPLELYWAQHGYVVYVQDNRGTSNRGAAFEKAINRQCGQVEMQDQMAGIHALLEEPWVDASRVGVHGWSYGGFMTISLMTNYPEVFKVGVAGGPVIDWKWYEVMYGERYMDTPETNPDGFEKTSLMNRTSDLKGKLLICQGAIDNTVVWEHSLSFVQKCIEEGVQLDYFPYPCSEHNVTGPWRMHLNRKIVSYFEENL